MKAKVLKRLIALVMSTLLMLGASVSAFATEVPVDVSANLVETSNFSSDSTALTEQNSTTSGTCRSYGALTLHPTLDSYSSYTKKTLYITVYVPSLDVQPDVEIDVTVYKPNGERLTSFKANPTVEEYYLDFSNPATGTYHVAFESTVNYDFFCTAVWAGW